MKKLLITTIMFASVLSVAYANDGPKYSENFISDLKAKSISADHDNYAVIRLNSKLRNHFSYISILRQDWTDELIMSLKSDIQPAIVPEKEKLQDDIDSPWKGRHLEQLSPTGH